ncbi:extracellular solute-binding protein [Microbacterium sp. EYE_5]|uniref:sugar ABC transporter substrate-binding protein n=1 Tax=unclassified Microbacterium TaxID=2609290 RepID=UPI002006A29B|nr:MULTISPECIES: extracellular solute-binding protein [unclassified Microbacterium]MCK6081640.1 extracellular solute-binding protein [Microbacterium sp. EYE_382]MCK6086910.1 extracellular solute-binding protein [Microbacterium sp. EYE_384]MCK6123592.1 extracellular solute-binding protein [Microbacterium sp. EYE_80]MCK6126501.1 extracellular solute-binding protein [Microbacterium sp. EYE_79]MCK6142594.1 extracellular solute-binding protein [Microbacterium sp. EYE_39]
MKKTLGALSLLGASALVLSGCAGGTSPAAESAETGDLTVWLVGTDTPQDARDYLKTTFEEEHEGWTLTVEEKTWADTAEGYVAALSSNDAPDLVEVGNTQAPGFIEQGLFADLSGIQSDLGGDDLLQSFVELGSEDGTLYAAPYYAGSRVVFFSPASYSGEVPETLADYVQAGIENTSATKSGIYAPGKDWYNALPYIWANGGEIATLDGDQWVGGFSSEGGIAGLEMLQDVYENATIAPADADETDPQVPFCAGEIGFLSAPSWVQWSILAAADAEAPGCPDEAGKDLTAFALPGMTAGEVAPVFAGGSNIAVAAKSDAPQMAEAALEIVLSEGYQKILAENGLIPARTSFAQYLPEGQITAEAAKAAASSKAVPASPKWSEVESAGVIKDALVKVAQGGDVAEIAAELDGQIESILNS